MTKPEQNARNDKGGPRTRLGTKVVAGIAALSLVASMCPGTVALAYVNGQYAAGAADTGAQVLSAQADGGAPADARKVAADTHKMGNGTYKVTGNVEIRPDGSGNAIQVEKGAKALLYLEEGATLTVIGSNTSGIGRAAILLPEGSTLTVTGKGTLNATGGNAGSGGKGHWTDHSFVRSGERCVTGNGGGGGWGGAGAGAGIGTDGGPGGAGGSGGAGVSNQGLTMSNIYGNAGGSGKAGSPAAQAGTLIITGSATVKATGGRPGSAGAGSNRGAYQQCSSGFYATSGGTSGGGGGGGGGSAADGIGSGGTGGGGGGGGASGSLDGEFEMFDMANLDDLWGYGGYGGSSTWGGATGARGDYGASNGGDDTNASKEYARSGGSGGVCAAPKTVAFYAYKDGPSSDPKATSTPGYDGAPVRNATPLGSLQEFKNKGGYPGLVSGGTSTYDGKPHGVSVNVSALSAQAEGGPLSAQADDGAGEWPDKGTVTIGGVEVSYEIAYYGEAGEEVGSAPVKPGRYAAVVTFTSENPDYNGSWVEPITISKRQVAKPVPAELTFECADWGTGEGAEQDAFPGLDSADYEFVGKVEAPDGLGDLKSSTSLKSAKEAGSYAACFKLKDPETCQWEGEPEDADEVWVPWSIGLQELDPNDLTYWGASYDDAATTVAYTGDPQWVRPWFAPAKDANGKLPEWLTHWGSDGRPGSDKRSAMVVYVQRAGDEQGLVGYHAGADGSLEPVTGAQVYAWANGVDVDGRHVDVSSGDKVWYKVGSEGWWEPLAVQEDEPEGADGFVVARDYDYVDKFGVMEPGTYQAYALFDEGAGFAPTALAEAAVEVKEATATAPVAAAETPKTGAEPKASASATPKTGDLSPLALGGAAVAALLGAGALALAARRRTRD